MIEKVFLDMDGVLTNFNKPICKEFNLPYPPTEYEFFEDIRQDVNDFCDIGFWEYLDWMPNGKEILELVESFFPQSKIYLITRPMDNPGCWTGKYLWVKKRIPRYVNHLIVTKVSKSVLANKNTLLIDDNDKNVDTFIGKSILVPRPWNRLRGVSKKAIKNVEASLEYIVNQEHEELNGI